MQIILAEPKPCHSIHPKAWELNMEARAHGGSRTLGFVVFFLCLLCSLHSLKAPFSTCCPVPIRHSPALGCSQQAPAII